MAAQMIKEVATVTTKGQTTLPKSVRQTLGVGAGDKICYEIAKDGRVFITRMDERDDLVIASFLEFLANDMRAHPGNLSVLSPALKSRMEELVGHIEVDLDEPIEGDVAL